MEAITVVWVKTTTELDDIKLVPVHFKRKGRYCIDGSVCMGDLEQENDPSATKLVMKLV